MAEVVGRKVIQLEGGGTRRPRLEKFVHHQPLVLQPRIARYMDLVAKPFDCPLVRCPVQMNEVPTDKTTLARTTFVAPNITVPNGTTRQYACMPGHGFETSQDSVANHFHLQTINATPYIYGPMTDSGPNVACGGNDINGITLGTFSRMTNVAGMYPLTYNTPLPYLSKGDFSHHSRWRLLSCGVRIENTTAESTRGGNVISVMPDNSVSAAFTEQAHFGVFDTFQISSEANEGTLEIAWIPRPRDLAFWHHATSGTPSTSNDDAGLLVWINNPTAVTQNYAVEWIWNWELAGESLSAVTSLSVPTPADRQVVEPTLAVARAHSKNASHMPHIAHAVAATISPLADAASTAAFHVATRLLPPRIREMFAGPA
jgi:hypothetical protein